MSSRAPIFAIAISVLFFLPAAAQAEESCVDHITNSMGDNQEVAYTLQNSSAADALHIDQLVLQDYFLQTVKAKQDLDNYDTIEAFIPSTNEAAHAALQSMRKAKEAQIESMKAGLVRLTNFIEKSIASMCAHAAADQAKLQADEADRATAADSTAPTDPNDHPGEAPPGGWGDPPGHNGSDSGDNGDATAAVVGGILLGGALANGGGGGGHHHGGGGSGGAGCHPVH